MTGLVYSLAFIFTLTAVALAQEEQSDFRRTVILIHKETAFGEHLFIRGGIDHGNRQGCGERDDLNNDPCSIAIHDRKLDIEGQVAERDAWAEGDDYLDWYGPEQGQGKFNGIAAEGTPAQWTTNDNSSDYYSPLNALGPNFWLVDVDMNCSQTEGGFFEFKAILNNQWEPAFSNLGVRCDGEASKDLPHQANNHFGQCGLVNVYEWGQGQCLALKMDGDEEGEGAGEEGAGEEGAGEEGAGEEGLGEEGAGGEGAGGEGAGEEGPGEEGAGEEGAGEEGAGEEGAGEEGAGEEGAGEEGAGEEGAGEGAGEEGAGEEGGI